MGGHVDLETLTDAELDAHRREVLAERERRVKLAEGLDALGRAICDYCEAARIDLPDGDPRQVGADAIEALTGHEPPTWDDDTDDGEAEGDEPEAGTDEPDTED